MTSYCLLWDNHTSNLVFNLTKLYETQQQLDITLRCENSDIGVHKCVLMAGSLYFQEQLRLNTSTTIIMIKSIQLKILKLLIEFIYKGEIYVEESDISSLLAAAKFFKISGLSGINSHEVNPLFANIATQSNFIQEPEFLQSCKEVIEEVLDEISEHGDKCISTEILDNSEFHLNTQTKETNEKIFDEILQDKIPSSKIDTIGGEYSETATETITEEYNSNVATITEECPENNVEIITEEYPETVIEEYPETVTVVETKVESIEETNECITATFDELSTVQQKIIPDELVVPDEEQFEDEEYLEEHLESFDEDSFTENVFPESDGLESNKALQVLQEAGVPTDVPIYCEGNDGSFVELTKDVLEEIASGGQVIYQVVDEEGRPGELLLGTTVKQSRAPTPQEPEISSHIVYDKLVSDAVFMSSPTPSLNSIEKHINNEANFENVVHLEDVETKLFENEEIHQPKCTRERKVNSRYYNSNLSSSPFLELSQRKAQKRTHSPNKKNGLVDENLTNLKSEMIENTDCDLIEQKIAELHADFQTDLTNYVNSVVVESRPEVSNDVQEITRILNDEESTDMLGIVKLASKRRKLLYEPSNKKKCKRFFKLFDSSKTVTENNDTSEKILVPPQRRKKTSSETSETSVQSTSKEIPYALGLLPLRKALKKIQNMPDHTPRKTRSNVVLNKTLTHL